MKYLSLLITGVLLTIISNAQPINDHFVNAIDVTNLLGSCSSDAAYSTVGATADGTKGSCWNNSSVLNNVWFKFTAPSTGQIYVDVGVFGSKGTQARTLLALWEDDGITELACDR